MKFVNPADPDNILLKAKIALWIKEKLKLQSEPELSVVEIPCGQDNCPCIQTQIILSAPFSHTFQIGKPLVYIRKWDIQLLQKPDDVFVHSNTNQF